MASSSSSFAIRKSNSIIQAGEKPHQKKKTNKPGSVTSIPPRTYLLCETRVVQAPVPTNDVVESSPERKTSLGGSVAEKLNDHNNFRFGGVAYHRTATQPTTAPSNNSSSSSSRVGGTVQSRSTSFTGKENHTKLVREQQSVPLNWRVQSQKFPAGRPPPSSSSSSSSTSGTISSQKTTSTSNSSSHHTSLHRPLSKPSQVTHLYQYTRSSQHIPLTYSTNTSHHRSQQHQPRPTRFYQCL